VDRNSLNFRELGVSTAATSLGSLEVNLTVAGTELAQQTHVPTLRASARPVRNSPKPRTSTWRAGRDVSPISVIALWLGHERTLTTHMYVEADLAMEGRALKTPQAPKSKHARYRPPDSVLEFFQGL